MTDIQKIVLTFWIMGFVCVSVDWIAQKIGFDGAYTIWILTVWTIFSVSLFLLLPLCR